ncbi:MAG: group 1 truncated hemoglobin [Comamonadaceae bacterium]|nr:MAG: group 1 truncated hemoglobin [Comamonadaceae bacterium]
MLKPLIALAVAVFISGLLAVAPVFAQSAPGAVPAAPAAAMPVAPNDQLYKAFGEQAGLVTLMDDFMIRLLADPRTGPHFKPANQQRVKEQLVDQFCALGGGPCVYKGLDMKNAHANLDIRKSDFNALVEVLQQSMDAQGIPFRRQNEMLALLAPMNRDTVTVK